MHWGYGIFGCLSCFTHLYLFAHIFYHFPPHLLFFSVIDLVIHFQGACYRTSYLPPHFSGPPAAWITVLGIGCSIPAQVACDLLPRWLRGLKTSPPVGILPRWVESGQWAMQDGVYLFCYLRFRFATSLPSISAAQHIVKLPPKGPWSFTTATRTGKVPLKWGALSAVRVQCARSATIWVSGRTRDPYFEILGASW